MSGAGYLVRDGVALLTLDNPPVNALSHELRRAALAGLERAISDPAVEACVLLGAGKGFSGGGDLRELETPISTVEPTLAGLIAAIEASAKPVVAAVHGFALGGGLELALGCHYRLAADDAKVALPEVKLGLLPGAGGTQRLPRLLALEKVLDMIMFGAALTCGELAHTGLFDQVVASGDPVPSAVAFARQIVARRSLPRARDRPPMPHANAEGMLALARTEVAAAGGAPAQMACLEAIAAATTKPFDVGLGIERGLFTLLLASPESRAMRHAFFAARAAAKIPDVPPETPTRPIGAAAVIGAGTMGTGIAMCFANAGLPVTLLEVDQAALNKGVGTIRKSYESSVGKGKLPAAEAERRLARIRPTLAYEDIAGADIVIEAVFEDMNVKRGVWTKLDEVVQQGAILATNTSTLDVNAIARFTGRPADVVGTHFFSPAHVMRLLEVVRGAATGKDVLATVMRLAKTLQKTAVVAGVCDGFIGNRMLQPYQRQAWLLLEEGALPRQVDAALESWGMAMGPFRMADLAGNDVGWYIRKRRYLERPQAQRPVIADRICELGRFGQKTGAGWYRYERGARDAIPDPAVDEIVVASSLELGVERRLISDAEIVERCVLALVNEGARVLEEGIALRASDVDLVYLDGYGFPRFRGGPLMYADTVGLAEVVRAMRRLAGTVQADSVFWTPAPLLEFLAAEGRTFTGCGAPHA